MGYLIGIDEAGYGPNFGPLVVTASVWQVPGDPRAFDFWKALRGVVVRRAGATGPGGKSAGSRRRRRRSTSTLPHRSSSNGRARSRPLFWSDSKRVYSPAVGLSALERGTLAAVAQLSGRLPPALSDLCTVVRAAPPADPPVWLDGHNPPLPRSADPADLAAASDRLTKRLASLGVRPVGLWSEVVFEGRFNALVAEHGNKANLLSAISLALLGRAWQSCPADEPIFAVLDRHGGRRLYGPILQDALGDRFLWCLEETAARSRYREAQQSRDERRETRERAPARLSTLGFRPSTLDSPREIHFEVGAERHLPVALASMTSKYLRELYMELFNAFWARHVDGLCPTAGYPTDAYRFRDDIRAAQQRLGIPDHLIWRVC